MTDMDMIDIQIHVNDGCDEDYICSMRFNFTMTNRVKLIKEIHEAIEHIRYSLKDYDFSEDAINAKLDEIAAKYGGSCEWTYAKYKVTCDPVCIEDEEE